MDNKKKQLLNKLKALAERGVGGEKETAQRKLEELMRKYGVEEADLSDEKKEGFKFKYKNQFEKRLILQIANKTFGDEWVDRIYIYTRGIGKRSIILIECTKFEETQIRIEYEFYKELWKEEVEFLFKVFIQKHNIFDPNGSSKNDTTEHKYSEKELRRMAMMEMLLQDKTMTKMLEVRNYEEKND